MAVMVGQVAEAMERLAPLSLMEPWDNCGLLLGDANQPVEGILLSLNGIDALEDAIRQHCNMVVSHHPVIFSALKHITAQDPMTSAVYGFLRNGISVYCAHTTLDKAPGGTADTLLNQLGWNDIGSREKFGRLAGFDGISLEQLAEQSAQLLNTKVRIAGDPAKMIHKAYVVPGSGGDELSEAAGLGADVFVTGELKYHDTLKALQLGMAVVELGHYESEVKVMETVQRHLQNAFFELQYNLRIVVQDRTSPHLWR